MKKSRKMRVCSLVLSAIMLLTVLTACDLFGASEPPERGVWDGNVFTSEHLGLTFTRPDSWEVATEVELAMTAANMWVAGDDSLEASDEDNVFFDMMVSNHNTGANVQIHYQRHGRPAPSASDVLDSLVTLNEQMGGTVILRPTTTTRIGNTDWYSLDSEIRSFGVTLYDRHFVSIKDGFVQSIVITYHDESELLNVIFAMFGDLSGQVPAERAQELVGTWDWDLDTTYSYNFYADGTGIRGYDDWIMSFEWHTIGNQLQLETEFMVETWNFSIAGGVLTLDSLNFDDTTYDYIKR